MKMSGITVGIDGSDHSHRALEWAMNEAAIRHAPLTVLIAHNVAVGYWGSAVSYPEDHALSEHAQKAAQEATDKAAAQLGERRPESVTVRALSGTPAEVLVSASEDADLLVVGSRGGGGFGHLLMGSVSTQVAHHAHCPVVIVRLPPRLGQPGCKP
jgi:nucleotide-binding universal stress UspA family protein